MKIEDAFLYVAFDHGRTGDELVDACARAVVGGGDILRIPGVTPGGAPEDADTARRVADLCRREEALLVLGDRFEWAMDLGASGVHLAFPDAEMGIVRAMLGADAIVGVTSDTLDQARLALEIGADYLVHRAGRNCAADFAALRDGARVPLFAAGLEGLQDAEILVAEGVYRLCVETARLDGADLAESVARYARLLGRCV